MSLEKFPLTTLTAFSPLDGRYRKQIEDLKVSEFDLIKARLEVEGAHMVEMSNVGAIRPLTRQEIEKLETLGPNLTLKQAERVKEIEDTVEHDVKAVEITARELLKGSSLEDIAELWHTPLTSEDVNNFAYRLLIKRATEQVCVPVLDNLINHLVERGAQYKNIPMLGRTHGQGAVGTTVGKEFINFAVRINMETRKLAKHQFTGKINGAVGNYNAFVEFNPSIDWIAYSKRFAEKFDFEPNLITTQINPFEDLIELFQIYQRTNGVILDLDQDTWRYISDHYFTLKVARDEVGSSTMAQKINPICFENSAGNLKIADGLFSTFVRELPISRLQRDLENSTIIRNAGPALGYSLLAYRNTLKGFSKVDIDEVTIRQELNKNYCILGEPAQIILKQNGGIEDPYTLVKNFVRGREVTAGGWEEWIKTGLPDNVTPQTRARLLKLTPETYLGLARELTDLGIAQIKTSRLS